VRTGVVVEDMFERREDVDAGLPLGICHGVRLETWVFDFSSLFHWSLSTIITIHAEDSSPSTELSSLRSCILLAAQTPNLRDRFEMLRQRTSPSVFTDPQPARVVQRCYNSSEHETINMPNVTFHLFLHFAIPTTTRGYLIQ
jgi:hypothetical protein